jgi:hypothetical protein
MRKRFLLLLTITAVLCIMAGLAAASPSPMNQASMSAVHGGLADCGTLAGATAGAAFLAGFGAITLLPALIGGAALVAFC